MGNDIYNMWDTIQVEIGAEFEKVKMSLGELKQISEGLVVDIGSVYDNKIELKVENKIVADGELVIINDRYGVKINQVYTEDKRQNSYYEEEVHESLADNVEQNNEEFYQHQETQNVDNYNQEEYATDSEEDEFDLSDFDVEEEDI